jgi:hypothetical protein
MHFDKTRCCQCRTPGQPPGYSKEGDFWFCSVKCQRDAIHSYAPPEYREIPSKYAEIKDREFKEAWNAYQKDDDWDGSEEGQDRLFEKHRIHELWREHCDKVFSAVSDARDSVFARMRAETKRQREEQAEKDRREEEKVSERLQIEQERIAERRRIEDERSAERERRDQERAAEIERRESEKRRNQEERAAEARRREQQREQDKEERRLAQEAREQQRQEERLERRLAQEAREQEKWEQQERKRQEQEAEDAAKRIDPIDPFAPLK